MGLYENMDKYKYFIIRYFIIKYFIIKYFYSTNETLHIHIKCLKFNCLINLYGKLLPFYFHLNLNINKNYPTCHKRR